MLLCFRSGFDRHSAEANNRALFCYSSTNDKVAEHHKAKLHDGQVIFNQMKVSDSWFAVCCAFQVQMSACAAVLPYQTKLVLDTGGCQLLCPCVCFCVRQEEWERLGECKKSILSGCVTTKLKFVLVLNIHSQCALRCTLFKSNTQQVPPWLSKSPQPPHQMAKWPYVTTLCVPSPFFLSHLASNEHCNGSPLPSKRTQIRIPVCFKHLLRPHLAESVLGWAEMWFLCPGAASCRQMQSESVLERKRKGRERDGDGQRQREKRQGREELVPLKASLLLPEPLVSTFLL